MGWGGSKPKSTNVPIRKEDQKRNQPKGEAVLQKKEKSAENFTEQVERVDPSSQKKEHDKNKKIANKVLVKSY